MLVIGLHRGHCQCSNALALVHTCAGSGDIQSLPSATAGAGAMQPFGLTHRKWTTSMCAQRWSKRVWYLLSAWEVDTLDGEHAQPGIVARIRTLHGSAVGLATQVTLQLVHLHSQTARV